MAKEAITGYTMDWILLHIGQSGETHSLLAFINILCQHTDLRLGTGFGVLPCSDFFHPVLHFVFERKVLEDQIWLQ